MTKISTLTEVIFVGIPGPTHNYGGLAQGNVASANNAGQTSRPKEAALQALGLATLLHRLGATVGLLPPQLRPDIDMLRRAGFEGEPEDVINKAAKDAPELLGRCYSSAAMWTANAATITPTIDCADGKTHITVANLLGNLHRSIEAKDTHAVLAHIFKGRQFVVHEPLPAQSTFADEGAANHMRLTPNHAAQGLHIFVYGREDERRQPDEPIKFPARQSKQACAAITRLHGITNPIFLKQNPAAIDAGVFHNDVIAVGNENVLLYHEDAFFGGDDAIDTIQKAYATLHQGQNLIVIKIGRDELSVEDAVKTYFFNSQIVTLPNGNMAILAPSESQNHPGTNALFERIRADANNPISEVHYLNLTQSMRNGGGPACLRLRVPLTADGLAQVAHNANVLLDDALIARMEDWIHKHYPDTLEPSELANPALYQKSVSALKELNSILRVPVISRGHGVV